MTWWWPTNAAKFGLPEVKRGLIAAAGGVFRIVQQLPRKVGMELLLTGEPITASDACEWGLINQVVKEGTVLDAALALAARVTVNAPLSVQASKRIAYGVDDGVITDDEAGWERTMREMRSLIRSEDAKEGPLAFAEKREPVWKARRSRAKRVATSASRQDVHPALERGGQQRASRHDGAARHRRGVLASTSARVSSR